MRYFVRLNAKEYLKQFLKEENMQKKLQSRWPKSLSV